MVPVVFFGYNDYLLYSLTDRFYFLLGVRLSFLAVSAAVIVLLARMKDYRSYDWCILAYLIVGIAVNALIQINRPPGMVQSFFIDMAFIIIFYLIIPVRLEVRLFTSLLFTAGELAIMHLLREPMTAPAANSIYIMYAMGNVTGAVMSTYIYRLRRREFRTREEEGRLREELSRMADIDSLTEVYNSRKFFELAEKEVHKCLRYQRPFTLAFLDIDHFKSVNDEYGHQAGDEVLRQMCRIVVRSLRAPDVFGRLGGEELGIVFPETGLAGAQVVCDRIRNVIAGQEMTIGDGVTVHLTVSIGLVAAPPEMCDLKQMLAEADRAMYSAKQLGRNRIEVAG
jgi:diguanylate cyclase (GGDEF)-like protein